MTEDVGTEWQKILWKEQPFLDNYVPPSFLSSLKRNSNFRAYRYQPLVFDTLSITQHTSALLLFVATFVQLHNGSLDPRFLVWTCILCFVGGYVIWEVSATAGSTSQINGRDQRAKTIKSSILVFLALNSVTPVLKTLTEASSSDSIWALSAMLFALNILLADYGGTEPGAHRLTSVLSMNAAISASVVLASRLRTNIAVFALVLLAVLLFALLPIVRKRLKRASSFMQYAGTIGLATAAITASAYVSIYTACAVLLALSFVTLACPAVLVWAQRYKNEIRGPWDPAVPRVHAAD